MRKAATWVVLIALVVAACAASPAPAAQAGNPPPALYRVYVKTTAQINALVSRYDVLEARGKDYLLVMGDPSVADRLRADGYAIAVDQVLPTTQTPFSYYGGYRSVSEYFAHMAALAATRPDLVRVLDYGVSWRRQQNAQDGHDLKAVCITRMRPGDCALNPDTDKPRFFLMAAIHARELTTSELAWRWMDALVDGYDVDPDLTALLDHNEMWIVPQVNPDGRAIVEQGDANEGFPWYQRKNANTSGGACAQPPTSFNQSGIDLNRNADFRWGGVGTSTYPCDATYRGTSAASEPEQVALQSLLSALFRDQRGAGDNDAAPITTTGVMLTLHSYSDLVMLPWGDYSANAPNDAALRSFAFRMSAFNGYQTGRPAEVLYGVTGSSDDWSYGRLGIASFTFEVGPFSGACGGFFPPYSCQDSTFWPLNRGAFLYAAKNARQPYVSALGPSTISATLSISRTAPGATLTLTAVLDDTPYGNAAGSVGRPASQPISAAQAYLDTPPWRGGTPIPMAPSDGAFDAPTEAALAPISTAGLCGGRHWLFVRGQDADGNWGATTAQWFTLTGTCMYLPVAQRGGPHVW